MIATFKRIFSLNPAEATFKRRGFSGSGLKRAHLESIGAHFVDGYNRALRQESPHLLVAELVSRDREWHGFAIEGAAMALALTDGFLVFGRRLPGFLQIVEPNFIYLAYVGAGWALARLPWARKRVLRSLDGFLQPLAYDGWGFHDTFFGVSRRRRIAEARISSAYRQGTGRALWFACAACPKELARRIAAQPAVYRADLWSGIGLAAAYAGGASEEDLRLLAIAAAEHRPWLAQGAAFGAEARHRAGWIPAHTDSACVTFAGRNAEQSAELARLTQAGDINTNGVGGYGRWRERLADRLAEEVPICRTC
jgi:enediyne biosynthesis protein E3